jgi:CheY-like chemotaxis protein
MAALPGEGMMMQQTPTAESLTNQILIVEDEAAIRETLAEILEDEGYTVARAPNGQEALAYLRSNDPPRLILLDLMMPVMNGWQFRAQQQQTPELAPIPVLIISGEGSLDQKAASLHVAGSMPKPIDVSALLEHVERYCR